MTLLQWYYHTYDQDPKVATSISKYAAFVLKNWTEYRVCYNALVTGFVGLAFADYLQPWATFVLE